MDTRGKTYQTVLHPDQYKQIENRLTKMVVTKETTELQAGVMLGIQMALKALREGFTIEG